MIYYILTHITQLFREILRFEIFLLHAERWDVEVSSSPLRRNFFVIHRLFTPSQTVYNMQIGFDYVKYICLGV